MNDKSRLKFYFICSSIVNLLVVALFLSSCAKPVEVDLDIICQIESGCTRGYRIYNPTSLARGLYQITEICLADYNKYHDIPYQIEELYDDEVNETIAKWYIYKRIPQLLKHIKAEDTVTNRLIAYNCGFSCVGKPLPRETEHYIKKYYKLKEE